jgi:hypothetical protein
MLFLSFRLTKAALPQFVVANGFIFFAVVQRKMCDLFKKSLRNQSPETSCRFTNDLFDFLVFPLFIYIYIYICKKKRWLKNEELLLSFSARMSGLKRRQRPSFDATNARECIIAQ